MESITVWPYGLALAAALIVTAVSSLSLKRAKSHAFAAAAGAAFFGLIGARLIWCCVNYSYYILENPLKIPDVRDGGLALFAGFVSGIAYVKFYAKRHSVSTLKLLDALTPGFALAFCILRAAEHYTGQGIGRETGLTMPLLTVADEYGMLRFNVRLYETVFAFIAFIIVLFVTRKKEGAAFTVGTGIICASQLVFETMREDDFLMIYFVRIEQLICALVLLGLSIMLIRRGKNRGASVLCLIMLLAGAALVIMQDFAVDASQEREKEYLIMAGGALVMLISVLVPVKFLKKGKKLPQDGAGILRTALSFIVIAALAAGCTLFVPSAGSVNSIPESMIPGYVEPTPTPTPEPTPEPTATPEPTPTAEPTATPVPTLIPFDVTAKTAVEPSQTEEAASESVPEPTATPEPTPTPTPVPTPTPTPKPTPVPLPMDSFEGGVEPLAEGYTAEGYKDDTIEVKLYKERIEMTLDGKRYLSNVAVADITIASPAQLRTVIAGDEKTSRQSKINNLSKRVNAVIGINGDYYGNRKGTYEVRQGKVLRSETSYALDTLIIDYNGDFHIYKAADREKGIAEMKGNTYQSFFFGPALIIDGVKTEGLQYTKYGFANQAVNPRTAIGQIGPLHYLMVVVEGRNGDSCGFTAQHLADYMYSKGCQQAFNLDGGATSVMVYQDKKYTASAREGYRDQYDMIYFASARAE